MSVLLAITIQVEHCFQDQMTDYHTTMDQVYRTFYSDLIKQDRYLHIL
jgi:hypothetical protein